MKVFLFFCTTFLCLLYAVTGIAQTNYDWTGAQSSDWSNKNNWRVGSAVATTVPGASDHVFIGNLNANITGSGANSGRSGASFISQPVIDAAYEPACASLTLGTRAAVTLTVNGKLTVHGDVTQKHNSGSAGITANISGAGTLACANFVAGDATAPALPVLGLYSQTFNTVVNSSIAQLNITNNLKLNTTSSQQALFIVFTTVLAYNVSNPTFAINGGTVTIGESIATSNSIYVNSGTTQNVAKFVINASSAAASVILKGATPLNLDSQGAALIDFYNNGSYASNVSYAADVDQTVYSNNTSALDQSPSTYQNIKLSGTGQKTLQAGAITIAGDWDAAGGKVDALANSPAITFQGSAQTLIDRGSNSGAGTVFKTVSFKNAGAKLLSSGNFSIAAAGTLTMASGASLNANGNLTLKSDASSSAAIASIPSGCSITGNVNVQRYLLGGTAKSGSTFVMRGYRMLSSPVNVNSKTDGSGYLTLNYIGNAALTGGSGTGFTVTNANPTLYLYREDVTPSGSGFNSGKHKGIMALASDNTVEVSGTSGSLQIPVGNGYIFYFVGNTSNTTAKTKAPITAAPESTIITATGTLNQSDVKVNLWYTPAGASTAAGKLSFKSSLGTNAGYNMVGNPYACSIDLDKVITDNSASINTSVYVLNNTNPGQKYIAYSKNGSSDPKASRYLMSGQGFMVQAKVADASLTFKESHKAADQQLAAPYLLMGMPVATNDAVTGFYMKVEQDSLVDDYCGIYFNASSSANLDSEDAKDLDSASPQLYMSSYTADGYRTAINHLPDYHKGSRIKLYVAAVADGLYKLKIEDIKNFDKNYNIWLKDRMMKDSLDIGRHKVYTFRMSRSDTSSFGANRFELVIRRKPMPPYQLISFSAEKIANGNKLVWKAYNEDNFTGFTVEKLGTDGQYAGIYSRQSDSQNSYTFTDTTSLAGGATYRLKQDDIDNKITYSEPVTISAEEKPVATVITISPNPTVETLNVTVAENKKATAYKARVYNSSGTLMLDKTMTDSSLVQNIGYYKPGIYVVELTNTDGSVIGRKKFIKN